MTQDDVITNKISGNFRSNAGVKLESGSVEYIVDGFWGIFFV